MLIKKPASAPATCSGIKKALKSADGFPASVLSMLAHGVDDIMSKCKEERHKFQGQCVEMVDAVLKTVEAAATDKVAKAEAKVAELSAEKGTRDATLEKAKEDTAAKKVKLTEAKEALAAAGQGYKEAKSAHSKVAEANKVSEAEFKAQEEKKAKLEAFLTEPFGKMKEGTLEASELKAGSAETLKIGKEYSFDSSLLTSIPSAIAKKPEERGPFDSICLQQVEDELKKKIAEMTEKLTAMEPAKAEKAAELAAAETAMSAAQQKELDSKDALNTAKEEEKASEEALKAAKDAVKDFMPEMSAACDAVDEAKAEKETLTDTALTPFKELVEWSNVVPEPEQLEGRRSCASQTVAGSAREDRIADILQEHARFIQKVRKTFAEYMLWII